MLSASELARDELTRLHTTLFNDIDQFAAHTGTAPFDWNRRNILGLQQMFAEVKSVQPDWTTVTSLWQIWDYFRRRLTQRAEPGLNRHLQMADHLASQVYQPFQAAFSAGPPKPPPFVSCEIAGTLQATAQSSGFSVVDDETNLTLQAIQDALPMPLIEVPLAQITHSPYLPLVAHETAHLVYGDFGIGEELEAEATGDWISAASEAFADVLAAHWMGPAYAVALFTLLDGQTSEHWGAYPPTSVRRGLVRAVLARTHQQEMARRLAGTQLIAERDVVDAFITRVLDGPMASLGGASVSAILPAWEATDTKAAKTFLNSWDQSPAPAAPRVLLAAPALHWAAAKHPNFHWFELSNAVHSSLGTQQLMQSGDRMRSTTSTDAPFQAAGRRLAQLLNQRSAHAHP